MVTKRTEELLKWDADLILHVNGTAGQNLGLAPYEGAQGIMIRDTEGKEYMDLSSQLVNVNLGHGRKDIAEVVKARMDKMMYISILSDYENVLSIVYSQKLAQVVPKGLDHFLFTATGSDADDCAFKIANL